ncbi:MAG: 50S ribosomal protein L22 [Proteobacteria bacterium]|nr:50S ribosomal protein L22 [Pseudomonadota bacterium]
MSKQKQPRRLADNQAMATLRSVRTSAQKARLVLDMIRGQSVDKALADLTFSKKKTASDVKALLQSAIANAENNHNLNVDKLVVEKATADKAFVMKRFHARARGRGARILKPTCHITLVVAEKHAQANEG